MKSKTCVITLANGIKEVYSEVSLFKTDSGVCLLSDSTYVWYDTAVVIKIECLGYEAEKVH